MSERTSFKTIRQRGATNKVAHRNHSPALPREALGRTRGTRTTCPSGNITEHKEKLILCKTGIAVLWFWDRKVDTSILRDITNPVGQSSELPDLALLATLHGAGVGPWAPQAPSSPEIFLMLQCVLYKSSVVILRLTFKMANTNPLPTALPHS